MSDAAGLAGVLAAHADCGIVNPDSGGRIRLTCGISVPHPAAESTVGWVNLHRDHVATAVLAWLETLAQDERVREFVAREWQRPEHAPMSDHDPGTGECVSCPWPAHMVLPPDQLATITLAAFIDRVREAQ